MSVVGFGAGLCWGHLLCGLCEVGQRDSVWACWVQICVAEVCINKFANVVVVYLAVHREGVNCSVFVPENVVYDVWS